MIDKSAFPPSCPLHTTGGGPCYCGKVHHEKVFFPGESMWVEVEKMEDGGKEFVGYIRNRPVSHLHEFVQDQRVRVRRSARGWFEEIYPVD